VMAQTFAARIDDVERIRGGASQGGSRAFACGLKRTAAGRSAPACIESLPSLQGRMR
jgi:hypothetical protein